ncbi:MAG: hypothetical protein HYX75_21610 [Acidobacteria bacterium]|nr:hypothetical protein [Acidobacteriota bacterium]
MKTKSARSIKSDLTAAIICALLASRSHAHELSGSVEAKSFIFFEDATDDDPPATGWGTLLLKEDARIGRIRVRASVRAEGITSAERGAFGLDVADRRSRRSPLSIRELYATIPIATAMDLQIGRFELGWGKTDGYSPADAFLPRDASDPLGDEKLPLWGARVQGQRGALRYELYDCAVTTPWRLPVMTGRYSPVSWAGIFLQDAHDAAPKRGFGAVRLQYTWGQWDFGLWGRAGVRPAPLIEAETDTGEGTEEGSEPLVTHRRFANESGAGLEVSRIVGSWVVRGEATALHSRDRDLRDALIWALGAERPVRDGSFIVTVMGNARATPINKAFLFDRALLPGFILAFNQSEGWGSWKIAWVGSFQPAGGVLKAEATYEASDTFSLTAGTDLPHGARSSPLGALSGARRIRTSMRWSW